MGIFCDTNSTEAEKVELQREIVFENLSCNLSEFNIIINPDLKKDFSCENNNQPFFEDNVFSTFCLTK